MTFKEEVTLHIGTQIRVRGIPGGRSGRAGLPGSCWFRCRSARLWTGYFLGNVFRSGTKFFRERTDLPLLLVHSSHDPGSCTRLTISREVFDQLLHLGDQDRKCGA